MDPHDGGRTKWFPRRLRLQFGLRSLLLFTLVVCLVLGRHVESTRRQRQAVAALTEAGAKIKHHGGNSAEFAAGLTIEKPRAIAEWAERATPRQLRAALGIDFFRGVDSVENYDVDELPFVMGRLRDLSGVRRLSFQSALDEDLPHIGALDGLTHLKASFSTITDEGLIHLRPLRKLEDLDLWHNAITGTGLVHLAHLRKLEKLNLSDNPLTDADLAHFAEFRRLRELNLRWSGVTGKGLCHLAGMAQLESLDLSFTKLADEHVIHLSKLGRLKVLSLHCSGVGDAGLRNLRDLRNLESLDISHTMVTDEGLAFISSLTGLKNLDLSGTAVSDKGLRVLGDFASLEGISIDETAATPEGAAWLRRRLPKTGIGFRKQGNLDLDQARRLESAGHWRQALEALNKLDPSSTASASGWHDRMGRCHARLGQWDQAEEEYCKALEHISRVPSQWSHMTLAWMELYAWPQLFERVARARPDDLWGCIASARRAVIEGRWSAANDDYARAVDGLQILDPLMVMHYAIDDPIYFEYGLSQLLAGNRAEHRRVCDRLMEGDPRIDHEKPSNGYDDHLFDAAHLHLLAPQGAVCRPKIADWIRNEYMRHREASRALAYCRAGAFGKVLQERGHMRFHGCRVWFLRAMAHQHLGHPSEARECFARGTQWINRHKKTARIWHGYAGAGEFLEAELLRREAKSLIFK